MCENRQDGLYKGARPQVEVSEVASFCSSFTPLASAGPAAIHVKPRRLSRVLGPAHTPSTMARPSSSRPSSAKKEIAASRDSTTMPTLSIRVSAMRPFYTMSSVLSTNERPGGSTNNRVLSRHDVVARCAPDALSVERYLSSRACHQWKHLPRTLRLTGSVCFDDFCPRLSSTEASA